MRPAIDPYPTRRHVATRRAWLATVALCLSACASTPPATVADVIATRPELSTLAKLVRDAGLEDTLRGSTATTVFAPNDDAFKSVLAKTMAELAGNREALKAVLTYHAVAGKLTADALKSGDLKTLNGAPVAISRSGSFVTVGDAVVAQADLVAGNGVVHVIDRVLLPPKR